MSYVLMIISHQKIATLVSFMLQFVIEKGQFPVKQQLRTM